MKCMVGKDRTEIDALISESLAEGLRLASEAHRSIRSMHQDRMVVTLALASILWIMLTFAIISQSPDRGGPMAMVASFIIVVLALTPLLYIDRRATHRRLAEMDQWIARIQHPAPDDSVFDLLVDISHQVPAWSTIKAKDLLRRHPILSWVGFISAIFAMASANTAYMVREEEPLIFPTLMAAALVLALLFVVSVRAIAVADRREREQTLARWNERMEASQHAMEEMLGGL